MFFFPCLGRLCSSFLNCQLLPLTCASCWDVCCPVSFHGSQYITACPGAVIYLSLLLIFFRVGVLSFCVVRFIKIFLSGSFRPWCPVTPSTSDTHSTYKPAPALSSSTSVVSLFMLQILVSLDSRWPQ